MVSMESSPVVRLSMEVESNSGALRIAQSARCEAASAALSLAFGFANMSMSGSLKADGPASS